VGLAIALLYGEVNDDRWRSRVKLIALALLLAMITNWIRIFIIVMAGHLTEMQHPLVSNEHYTFGWYMFAGTMLVFFLIARRWPVHASAPVDTAPATGVAVPVAGVALAVAGLAIAGAWNLLDDNRAAPVTAADLLPGKVAGWSTAQASQTPPSGADAWRPVFRGADGEYFAAFSGSGTRVDGYAAYYLEQHQGKELVSYENSALGDGARAESGARPVAGGPWVQQRARARDGSAWLVWHALRLDSQWQSRGLALQLNFGLRSLSGAPRADVIALRAPCAAPDCGDARRALEAFVTAAWPVPHS
jgi:EpsI family protein